MSAQSTPTLYDTGCVSLEDIVINAELHKRRLRKTALRSEFAAMHSLASVMTAQGSVAVLKRLAALAIESREGGVLLSVHWNSSEEISRARDLLKQTGAEDIASAGEAGVRKEDKAPEPVVR